ncbi:Double-stranded RNA-binding protein 3 [Euphorbia peplus]|nr:Double-stranded RNA-binding protein 3 [Euphorbia peplus]
MFKNQLQELAQRSCFNLPSYLCSREGPDHAPRFKACVNFNGEMFESPSYCSTLRQAEHSAAEVALNVLSSRGPSRSLTARVLDETGVYKNLLQETAHRAGLNLPVYTSIRSGPSHVPTFTCSVELAGMNFKGDPAKTKKQAEKNAAIAAWSALKIQTSKLNSLSTNKEEEGDQRVIERLLSSLRSKEARTRDFSQSRRRIVKGYNTYTPNAVLYQQHLKLLDLLLDCASDSNSPTNKNSYVSLLPPPPPRTTSKILPPNNTFSNPKEPLKFQETPNHVQEEHKKDEEEWLGSNSRNGSSTNVNVCGSSTTSLYGPFPSNLCNSRKQESIQIGSSSRPNPCSRISPFYSHKMAPAVHIRSVIPVCAAPPAVRPAVIAADSSKNTHTGAAEVSMVNKAESQPILQLGTDLNKKLQL